VHTRQALAVHPTLDEYIADDLFRRLLLMHIHHGELDQRHIQQIKKRDSNALSSSCILTSLHRSKISVFLSFKAVMFDRQIRITRGGPLVT